MATGRLERADAGYWREIVTVLCMKAAGLVLRYLLCFAPAQRRRSIGAHPPVIPRPLRLGCAVAIAILLTGCGAIHTESISPNDPGYWYSEAPRTYPTYLRAPGNERIYRPLGGAVY